MSNVPTLTLSSNVFNDTPLLFDDLTVWYDTSSNSYLTLDGTAITQMLDRSGNGYDTDVQATSTKRPTFNSTGLNSLGTAELDGGDTLELPSDLYTVPAADNTVIAVAKRTSEDATVDSIVTMSEAGATRFDLAYDSTSGAINYRSNATVSGDVQITGATNTDFQIIIGRRDAGTVQGVNYNNNTEITNANAVDEPNVDSAFIGSANDASNYLTGSIAELIVYSRVLSNGDLLVLYEYLAQKWNITI